MVSVYHPFHLPFDDEKYNQFKVLLILRWILTVIVIIESAHYLL